MSRAIRLAGILAAADGLRSRAGVDLVGHHVVYWQEKFHLVALCFLQELPRQVESCLPQPVICQWAHLEPLRNV